MRGSYARGHYGLAYIQGEINQLPHHQVSCLLFVLSMLEGLVEVELQVTLLVTESLLHSVLKVYKIPLSLALLNLSYLH